MNFLISIGTGFCLGIGFALANAFMHVFFHMSLLS
jgi:hypothetical protein